MPFQKTTSNGHTHTIESTEKKILRKNDYVMMGFCRRNIFSVYLRNRVTQNTFAFYYLSGERWNSPHKLLSKSFVLSMWLSLSHTQPVLDVRAHSNRNNILLLRLIFAPKNGDEHEPTPFTMYNSLTCHIFNVRLKQQMIKSSICFAHPPSTMRHDLFGERNDICVVKNALAFFVCAAQTHRTNECLRRRARLISSVLQDSAYAF